MTAAKNAGVKLCRHLLSKALHKPCLPAEGTKSCSPSTPLSRAESRGASRGLGLKSQRSRRQEKWEGAVACPRWSKLANTTNAVCEREKGPRLYLLPRAAKANVNFVGCPLTSQKRKTAWTQGSVSGLHWSAKSLTSIAALSASLFRGTAVLAAMSWDVTTLKSWWCQRDPKRLLITVSGGTQWCIWSSSLWFLL